MPFYLWLRFLVGQRLQLIHRHHLGTQKRDAGRTVTMDGLDEAIGGHDYVAYEALQMVVDELIAKLPTPQDRMIQLRIEGHEIAAIAKLTGRSKRTVERTLQLFRTRLAELIDTEH